MAQLLVRTKTHRAKKGDQKCNALDRSRGGVSTKIHAVVNVKGGPSTSITPGQGHK
jgi:hypothetical protein